MSSVIGFLMKRKDSQKRGMMKFKKSITNEEIKKLPRKVFDGDIFLIDNQKKLDIAIPLIKKYDKLGFDTEAKPSFKKGKVNKTALLQLATNDKAFLFRLNHIGFPDELVNILSDNSILKIGLAIKDDLRDLKKAKPFKPGNFIDLQDLAQDLDIQNTGLKKLSAIVLEGRISKSQRLSNWENNILTPAQLKYAATDAWICYELYNKLTESN
ncbi:MAG: 3'-5' exonuclease [Bacteroidia bacterium]